MQLTKYKYAQLGGLLPFIFRNYTMQLDQEWQAYQANLTNLLEHQGKFVVIHRDKILGIYACEHDALLVGYERVGHNAPFLVKKIIPAHEEKPIISLLNPVIFQGEHT